MKITTIEICLNTKQNEKILIMYCINLKTLNLENFNCYCAFENILMYNI
jgi:hypothetical protein